MFFAMACALSWIIWAPLWLPRFGVHGLPVLPFHHALGAFGPLVAAMIVSFAEAGREGPVDLARHMVLWRNIPWLAIALLGPLALLALAKINGWMADAEHFHATIDILFTSTMSSPFIVNAAGAALTLFGITVILGAGPRHLSRHGMVVHRACSAS